MNRVLVLKYEKGYFSPKILARGEGQKAHEIISLAKENGVSLREERKLLESLWNSSYEKEEEVLTVLSDFLHCIYEIEKGSL